ncbi:MAG: SPOR domain-containing protein [Novosphingobium sp.]|uniref:SPOR domain-containing protein n=1 Tax=Novosphingobium sp. NDB2Meth1 TaxID=1892847 RepID=UPI00093081E0|nr:SPOR domain-containing protein [Novosphingobium sp. NDB2Meth1]MBY0394536.1 SPOR domain-containing protein [Novosphingobium sp.]
MKLPVNRNNGVLALAMVLALGAGLADPVTARDRKAAAPDVSGPAGDYPVTLGEPFVVDGVTYTPADTLNYDAVGKAVAMGTDEGGAGRINGAHRTLPVPSYVEVTSLSSGRTILVRIDRRGPMSGEGLVALSPMAWSQLGLPGDASAPVRVRRVNPPEPERALLRTGQAAPQRMDTPPGLLAALRRKLGLEPPVGDLPVTIRPAEVAPGAPKPPAPAKPAVKIAKKPTPEPQVKPAPKAEVATAPKPAAPPEPPKRPAAAAGRYYVQIGAFSQRGNAEAAARKAGGSMVQAGSLWRVRSGPFSAGDEAERGLAKARAAGYAGARIVRD